MSRHKLTSKRSRALKVLGLLLVLATTPKCDGGCGSCGGSDQADVSVEVVSVVPSDWQELTRGYAEHLPLGTHGVLVARGFEEVSAAFLAIKAHIHSYFDLGAIESEIRNTFGVDLNRHVTFREVGLSYDGGFALATVMQQPVLAFYLTDPTSFVDRANVVLRRQPFNLRAPVQTETVGESQIHLYSRRLNQPVEIAVVIHDGHGFLIDRATSATELADVARQLIETTPETSLASHPDFDTQVARFDDLPGFIFIDTAAASSFYRDRYSDQLSQGSAHVLDEVEGKVRSIAGGARLDDLTLSFRAYVGVADEVAEASAGIEAETTQSLHLERFILPSTFAAIRVGADPSLLWETFLLFQSERAQQILRERTQTVGEAIGVDIFDEIAPILSGNGLIMINRLAPLSLFRAENLADYADAVDLMAVFELADPEGAAAMLDTLVVASQGAYQRIEEGDFIRYATGRGEHGFGNLIIRDDLLLVAADRMRRIATQPLPEGTGAGLGNLVADAQAMITDEVATGAFLTFERIVPVITLLNYPQIVRDILAFLDTIAVRVRVSEQGLLLNGSLTLKALE